MYISIVLALFLEKVQLYFIVLCCHIAFVPFSVISWLYLRVSLWALHSLPVICVSIHVLTP